MVFLLEAAYLFLDVVTLLLLLLQVLLQALFLLLQVNILLVQTLIIPLQLVQTALGDLMQPIHLHKLGSQRLIPVLQLLHTPLLELYLLLVF